MDNSNEIYPAEHTSGSVASLPPSQLHPHKHRKRALLIACIGLVAVIGLSIFVLRTRLDVERQNEAQADESSVREERSEADAEAVQSIVLDYTRLPLGDGRVSTSPKKGYVYSCQTTFSGGGADTYGPWINQVDKTWDLTAKIAVDGAVSWPDAYWEASYAGDTRTIRSADLPYGHVSGEFPISQSDEAYAYDSNPNKIMKQSISFTVPRTPTVQESPECVGGEVGIATTGVLLFNAFDAGGRDAVAVEVQDECEGHPQAGSYYHYHGYSSCFDDKPETGRHSGLQGYAFDGFGVYGLQGEGGVEMTSADLDECHGHTHPIVWDGENPNMYHYHFTQDFPYTVSCFRGKPSVKGLSSGEGSSRSMQSSGTQVGTSGQGGQSAPVKPKVDVPPPGFDR